jgi:hypothetical protein
MNVTGMLYGARMRRTSLGKRSSAVIAKARNRISNIAFATKIPDTRSLSTESPEQSAADRSCAKPRSEPPINPFAVLAKSIWYQNVLGNQGVRPSVS